MQDPSISDVSAASELPIEMNVSTAGAEWDGKDPDDKTLYYVMSTGYDLLETMKIELVGGRAFSREFGLDSMNVIVNETAARAMGMDRPLGQRLALWGREGQIIGVVKDFHMRSLYEPIEPVIFRLEPGETRFLFVRAVAGRTEEALSAFETAFKRFSPGFPVRFWFLDDEFEETYRNEAVVGSLVNYFAGLAIIIACLGLFALASFTAESRTREIGIRKVMGASVASIVLLLSRDFVRLVVIAFLMGLPVAYVVMSDWLTRFEYHTEIGIGVLLSAVLTVFLIVFASVGYQSVRAAIANPVDSLRSGSQ